MLVILVGVDGTGKSTVARSLVDRVRREGRSALLLQNYSGRRNISAWAAKYGCGCIRGWPTPSRR